MRHLFATLAVLVAFASSPAVNAGARPSRAAAVRAELAARRATAMERLHAYAAAGRFPHDFAVAPALHIFRDDAGRLCAVANLVHLDARDDLVDTVVRTQNDLAIADVHEGPLHDWILGSGLTQEELARIQKPAPMVERPLAPPAVAADGPAPMTEEAMNAAMVAHLRTVETELEANAASALDLATSRYLARKPS